MSRSVHRALGLLTQSLALASMLVSCSRDTNDTFSLEGTYKCGGSGFWSETLRLDADGTFVLDAHQDARIPGRTLGARGTWALSGDLLQLRPEQEAKWVYDGEPVGALRVIHWGSYTYLVQEDEGMAFCESVNSGSEPRVERSKGRWFRRIPAASTRDLALPDAWRRYLLDVPLHGQIVEALPDGDAVANMGADDGVFEGMTLFTNDLPRPWDVVELDVIEVLAGSCRVRYRHEHARKPALHAGLGVSSQRRGP